MNLIRKIKTASEIWRKHGWSGIKNRLQFNYSAFKQKKAYRKWIREFDTLTDETRKNLRREIGQFSHKPLISIILPVYNVEEKFLRLCIESIRKQIYENWELCIADDCSPSPHIRRVLEEYAQKERRIKVVFRKENGHISAASNSALKIAIGEFCVFSITTTNFRKRAFLCRKGNQRFSRNRNDLFGRRFDQRERQTF